jgi:glycosyltransferase involved in cell wall biosynthesis
MNILYIGPYRQADGWGEAAHDYVMALHTTPHNLTIRPIYMASSLRQQIPKIIPKLETTKYDHYDVVIQHVLPHLVEYVHGSKNVCLSMFETGSLEYTEWPRKLNCLIDELWVPSIQEKCDLMNSGVKIPIHNIGAAIDVTKFEKTHDMSRWLEYGLGDTFNFYFIGEYIPRKNLDALVVAFHREFSPDEPVNLILKVNKGGMTSTELANHLGKELTGLKKSLHLYQHVEMYKNDYLLTEYVPEAALYGLHQVCDCFVMPSRGEAFCRPAIDAMGFGNTPIVTNGTGMTSFINTWSEIDILHLQRAMRTAYERRPLERARMQEAGRAKVQEFSYENIGKAIDGVLTNGS